VPLIKTAEAEAMAEAFPKASEELKAPVRNQARPRSCGVEVHEARTWLPCTSPRFYPPWSGPGESNVLD
jgi:hypothetical protein